MKRPLPETFLFNWIICFNPSHDVFHILSTIMYIPSLLEQVYCVVFKTEPMLCNSITITFFLIKLVFNWAFDVCSGWAEFDIWSIKQKLRWNTLKHTLDPVMFLYLTEVQHRLYTVQTTQRRQLWFRQNVPSYCLFLACGPITRGVQPTMCIYTLSDRIRMHNQLLWTGGLLFCFMSMYKVGAAAQWTQTHRHY